jgi:hypothetical protein
VTKSVSCSSSFSSSSLSCCFLIIAVFRFSKSECLEVNSNQIRIRILDMKLCIHL